MKKKALTILLLIYSCIIPAQHPGEYYEKIIEFRKSGQTDSARIHLQKLLDLTIDTYSEQDSMVAITYGVIGDFYYENSILDTALQYYDKAAKLYQDIFGERSDKIAFTYSRIGTVYHEKGEDEEAEYYLNYSEAIFKKVYGSTFPPLANVYENLAEIYFSRGRYGDALDYYHLVEKIDEYILPPGHPDLVFTYTSLALVYESAGNISRAIAYHRKVIDILDDLGNDEFLKDKVETNFNLARLLVTNGNQQESLKHFRVVNKLAILDPAQYIRFLVAANSYIGNVFTNSGELDSAFFYLNRSLYLSEGQLAENDLYNSSLNINFGNYYLQQAQYDLALIYYRKAMDLILSVAGEDYPDLAQLYNNIGNVYRYRRQNELALEYYNKALYVHNMHFDESHPMTAVYYNNLGVTNMDMGRFREALENMQTALLYNLGKEEYDPLDLVKNYNNIGLIYNNLGNFSESVKNLINAEDLANKNFESDHPVFGMICQNLGFAYYNTGRFDLALEYYKKALMVNRLSFGSKHPEVARNYNSIAVTHSLQGEYQLAADFYQRGIDVNLMNKAADNSPEPNPFITGYKSPYILIWSYYGRAQALSGLGQHDRAFTVLQYCDTLLKKLRETVILEKDKLTLSAFSHTLYGLLIPSAMIMSIYPPEGMSPDEFRELAFRYAEGNKSALLMESLSGKDLLRNINIPDSLKNLEEELRYSINNYEQMISMEMDSARRMEYSNTLFGLNRQYNELKEVLRDDFPGYFNLAHTAEVPSVKSIQEVMNPNTAIRSYYFSENTISVFTLTRNELEVMPVALIPSLADSISLFRQAILSSSDDMNKAYLRLGHLLHDHLFPGSQLLSDEIEELIIIPDGYLSLIPFDCLLYKDYNSDITNYTEYPYLAGKYEISYSYSASLYYNNQIKQSKGSMPNQSEWLGLAPVFEDYSSPLPGTKREVESIGQIFSSAGIPNDVLLYDEANEDFIKSSAGNYNILHFATHGFASSADPNLSGLLLGRKEHDSDYGMLMLGEILNLDLNADLVVLSACETGVGRISTGEGVIGLVRALLYAGGRNIIASLWPVNDESTSLLMVDFYKQIISGDQQGYAKALHKAKLKMISDGVYAHPRYWSPFILIGQ